MNPTPITKHFLADLQTVAGGGSSGIQTVNGNTYVHSLNTGWIDWGSCKGSTTYWEYDLGRHYNTFHATIGLNDASPTDAHMQYEVQVDGNTKYSSVVGFGQSPQVQVSLDGGLRLKLIVTEVSEASKCSLVVPVWGDATLTP